MSYDLVIIGAGLAGMTAALKALQQGMKTIVVSAGASTMNFMSGCLDLCGGSENPWLALRKLASENPGHPYALLKEEEIHEALSFFVEQTKESCPYHYQNGFHNFCIPTAFGNQRCTCLLPEGQLAAAGAEGRVLVVGLKGYRDFCAGLMVEGIQKKGYQGWQAAEVDLGCLQPPGSGAAGKGRSMHNLNNNVEIAARLEQNWQLLAEELRGKVQGFDAVAFPAVLGMDQHLQVKRGLEESLGVKVFEVPTIPPSLPGVRLARSLETKIRHLGGDLLQGFPVAAADLEGRFCSSVVVSTPGRPRQIKGKSFILATGGILGGGIMLEHEDASEVVFHLPVSNLGVDIYTQVDPHAAQAVPSGDENQGRNQALQGQQSAAFSQPQVSAPRRQTSIFQAGVRVNQKMQPLDVDGGVLLENVFCAGKVLAGYDPFSEGSGAGVAIATGYKAVVEARRMMADEQ